MVENKTNLVIILDKSGSMHGLEEDVVGGYNALIEEQKKLDGKVDVTTILFNDKIETLYSKEDIKDIKPMTKSDYRPGGSTALLDTIGYAIRMLDDELEAETTIISIMTDGYENASRKYTYPLIKQLIQAREKKGWKILFQGANINVREEANNLGIDEDNAIEFDRSTVKCCMSATSGLVSTMRKKKHTS